MLAQYFSIIPNYVLSVFSQRKCNFYHQNTLLDAFRTTSRNIIGRNPSMVIPLLTNQDLMPMLVVMTRNVMSLKFCESTVCRGPPSYGSRKTVGLET